MAYQSTLLLALLVITTSSLAHGLTVSTQTVQTNILGTVVCSASGNYAPGNSAAAGVRVNLTCDDGRTNLRQVVTNAIGAYEFILNATESLLFKPSTCYVRVGLPLPNCTVSPRTGYLRGLPILVGTLLSAVGKVAIYLVPVLVRVI